MTVQDNYVRTEADRKAVDQGCYFDEAAAERVCRFFETQLFLSKGPMAREPFRLLPFQKWDILYPLFGWKRADGLRRFRQSYISFAKKSGKTKLGSGIVAYMLTSDGEESPIVVSAACDRSQASQIFDELAYCIRLNPRLRDATVVTPSTKLIRYPKKNGKYLSLSSDAPSKEGLDISCCLVDEMHAHRSPALFNALRYSGIARKQPLQIIITTAGVNRDSLCYAFYRKSKDILAGRDLDTTFFPAIWEVPEDCKDLDNPEVWRMANPGLGVVFDEDDFRAEWEAAKRTTAGRLEFLRYRFNIWTQSSTGWIDPSRWAMCQAPITEEMLAGQPCMIGVDLSSTTDLSSIVCVFPIDGKYYVRHRSWVPEMACKLREKQNLTRYETFQADGNLRILPGNCINYDEIIAYLEDCNRRYAVQKVIIEKWNNLRVSQELQKKGFEVLEFPTSSAFYNGPAREFEKVILEKALVHDGDSLLSWAVQNVQLSIDAKGMARPEQATESQKIDPAIALIIALSQARVHDLNAPEPFDLSKFIQVV